MSELTQDVFIGRHPKWHFAVYDRDGTLYLFESMPTFKNGYWYSDQHNERWLVSLQIGVKNHKISMIERTNQHAHPSKAAEPDVKDSVKSMQDMARLDWNDMSELGLIQLINDALLHPLGLAISRNPKTGFSEFIVVADDGYFTYFPEIEPVTIDKEQITAKIAELLKNKHD